MRLRYRPIRMRDISSASWFVNPVVGLIMTGFDLAQRMNKEMNKEEAFYCSAPASWRYGLCFKDVTVEDSVKNEDIPYMCERRGHLPLNSGVFSYLTFSPSVSVYVTLCRLFNFNHY